MIVVQERARSKKALKEETCVDLQQRIERLEHKNRQLKWVGLTVVFAAGMGLLLELHVPAPRIAYAEENKASNVVITDGIVIKDNAGNERVRIGIDSNNRAYLQLRGTEINPGFGVTIDEKGLGDLGFFGKDGNEQVIIRTTPNGTPDIAFRKGTINIYDSKVSLFKSTLNALPESAYNLVEGDGTLRSSLTFSDKIGPSLRMYYPKGKRMVSLGDEQNGAFLTLFDTNDKRTVSLGTNAATGTFLLFDNQYPELGKTLVELERSTDHARIRFVDKAGKEVILP
jgi:hypothetical protein